MNERTELLNLVGELSIQHIQRFDTWTTCQQIVFLGWFFQKVCNKETFTEENLQQALNDLDITPPASFGHEDIIKCPEIIGGKPVYKRVAPNKAIPIQTYRLKHIKYKLLDKQYSSIYEKTKAQISPTTGLNIPLEHKHSLLETACKKGEQLLQTPHVIKQYYKEWSETTLEMLKSVFGQTSSLVKDFDESKHIVPKQQGAKKFYSCSDGHHFTSLVPICGTCGKRAKEDSTRVILTKQLQVLNAKGFMLRPVTASLDFFDEFDTDIQKVSKQKFRDAHLSDAVLAAFRELNEQIKNEYKKRKNQEQDGTKLMQEAFSANNPVFLLGDVTTQSGKDIQIGFMELFTGSIRCVRNPHSHANIELDFHTAKHFLYLADLLMKKFKAALRT